MMPAAVAIPFGRGRQKADGLQVARRTGGANVNLLTPSGPGRVDPVPDVGLGWRCCSKRAKCSKTCTSGFMYENITSIKDKRIALARSLKTRTGREDRRRVLLEGEQILDWAIERAMTRRT